MGKRSGKLGIRSNTSEVFTALRGHSQDGASRANRDAGRVLVRRRLDRLAWLVVCAHLPYTY